MSLDSINRQNSEKNSELASARTSIRIGNRQLEREKDKPTRKQVLYFARLRHVAEDHNYSYKAITGQYEFSREGLKYAIKALEDFLVNEGLIDSIADPHYIECKDGIVIRVKDPKKQNRCGLCEYYNLGPNAEKDEYMRCQNPKSYFCGQSCARDLYCSSFEEEIEDEELIELDS